MFRCAMTGEASRPREKMIKVVIAARPDGSILREVGVRLVSVDPEAATKLEASQVDVAALTVFQRRAYNDRLGHSRGCKKPLDDCKVCQLNILWFASIPPRVLSGCLEERRQGGTK